MTRARSWSVSVAVAIAALTAVLWATAENGDTTDRSVAQVMLLRAGKDAGRGLEVLLKRNGPNVFLAPNQWVFPAGGTESDNGGADAARAAAISAVAEETGIDIDAAELVPYAHWIVPGFDTIFYLAGAPADSRPRPSGSQTVDVGWFEPRRALELHLAGKMPMGYPAIKQLESLAGFATATKALETARHLELTPIHLHIVGGGGNQRAVLPNDAP